jgi:cation transport regulator ChaB
MATTKTGSGSKTPKKSAASQKSAGAESTSVEAPLPGTLERSPAKVQRTYEKTLESAEAEYGDEARAHRTAWGSVKNVAEKRGDHWELKESTGPSDPRSTKPAEEKRAGEGETFGGVDIIGNTRWSEPRKPASAVIHG